MILWVIINCLAASVISIQAPGFKYGSSLERAMQIRFTRSLMKDSMRKNETQRLSLIEWYNMETNFTNEEKPLSDQSTNGDKASNIADVASLADEERSVAPDTADVASFDYSLDKEKPTKKPKQKNKQRNKQRGKARKNKIKNQTNEDLLTNYEEDEISQEYILSTQQNTTRVSVNNQTYIPNEITSTLKPALSTPFEKYNITSNTILPFVVPTTVSINTSHSTSVSALDGVTPLLTVSPQLANATLNISQVNPRMTSQPQSSAGGTVIVVLTLGILVVVVGLGIWWWLQKRRQLELQRLQLLPVYNYDPADDQDDWENRLIGENTGLKSREKVVRSLTSPDGEVAAEAV